MLLNLILCVILSKESHKISVVTSFTKEKGTIEQNILVLVLSLYMIQ